MAVLHMFDHIAQASRLLGHLQRHAENSSQFSNEGYIVYQLYTLKIHREILIAHLQKQKIK